MLLQDAVTEYLVDCRIRRMSPRTIRNYRMLLSLLVKRESLVENTTELEKVQTAHLKRYLLQMEEAGRKPQYINDMLKVMKVFFKYCALEGYITSSPAAKLHNVRQPKVLIRTFSEEEVRRMLGYFSRGDFLSVRNRTMLAMFFDTGMRLAEVITLRPEQLAEDRILVHGKGSKERLVPISPYLAKQLIKYQNLRASYFSDKLPPEPQLFVSRRGRMLTPEAVKKFMVEAAKAVHVSPDVRVSPHTCRHTFAHLQLKNGLDLYSLSRLMGHENIAITQRYPLRVVPCSRIARCLALLLSTTCTLFSCRRHTVCIRL